MIVPDEFLIALLSVKSQSMIWTSSLWDDGPHERHLLDDKKKSVYPSKKWRQD